MNDFSRQFGEWGTALQEKYRTDLFSRTTINIGILSVGFVLACLGAFALALWVQSAAWFVFVGILLIIMASSALLARILLKPVRDTLHYQKLFISNVAHELRTPLSTIKTSTEVALLDEKLPRSLQKIHLDVLEELNRISEIINNLLSLNTLTRPERIEFKNVDLGDLIDTTVRHLQPLARERNIEMVVKKDNYRIVWGNSVALEQVMTNVVKNAISYTPKGINGIVTISIQPDYKGSIVFSVVDTGIGISQEDLFHIFEPFYRADTSRVRNISKSGSGLGLTIVNEIVRVHHGKINIQSAPRRGTTVSVILPSGVEMNPVSRPEEKARGSEISFDFSKKV